jgi:hypothetical protein
MLASARAAGLAADASPAPNLLYRIQIVVCCLQRIFQVSFAVHLFLLQCVMREQKEACRKLCTYLSITNLK